MKPKLAPIFLPILLSTGVLLPAADPSTTFLAGQKVQVSHTDRLSLPAGGVVRLQHSFGEAGIEGWDRPEVEVTVIKSTKGYFASAEDAKATAELDRVHITAQVQGKDVVVTTAYPHHSFPFNSPWAEPPVDVEYRIMVPKDAAIVVQHGNGEVHFYNVSGDIQAHVRSGEISLDVPPADKYALQAGSHWGAVISDYPGRPHRRFWLVGHQFTGPSADGAHKLVLKANYGDVIVMKAWEPPATPATH
ncbi:MAG TPA: hypothetical protein VME43_33790 [Bryobacteraceae bacterium]|nr:hypothetical protein [Bryobacteraceae bacterium]